MQTKKNIDMIFSRLAKQRPKPQGELAYKNAFTLLVAVVLSAQATDKGVNRATKELFKKADSPQKMLKLGETKVRNYIKTIGLFRNKAKSVIGLSKMLLENYGGKVPNKRDELVKLPGVGRKTANVVLSIAFKQKTIAVDTHIFRLSHRLGLAKGKTPDEIELQLEKRIPDKFLYHAHQWLILHGRYICRARNPLCQNCIIADLCMASEKTNSLPATIKEIA